MREPAIAHSQQPDSQRKTVSDDVGPPRRAVVLAVDRLGTFCLGPYGNTWVETPGFNRLAARSLLCERMIIDSPFLDPLYRGLWQGTHALAGPLVGPSLPEQLRARQSPAVLVTDEPEVGQWDFAAAFEQPIQIPLRRRGGAASVIHETQLAQGFATALEVLDQDPPPALVWIHLQGMQGAWDAPTALRNQFADEDDPLPGEFTVPPQRRLSEPVDPDELLQVTHAYAGQVAVLDACLEVLLDALDAGPTADSTLLVVLGCRGYPLGEHGRIGACDNGLYGELLQVPCLLRYPRPDLAGHRLSELVQPADLHRSLSEWLGLPAADVPLWGRDLSRLDDLDADHPHRAACSLAPGQRAIRTPGWFLRTAEGEPPSLYVKPDDLWEVNEVADRCPEVVRLLQEHWEHFQQAAQAGQPQQLPPLPPELLGSS